MKDRKVRGKEYFDLEEILLREILLSVTGATVKVPGESLLVYTILLWLHLFLV